MEDYQTALVIQQAILREVYNAVGVVLSALPAEDRAQRTAGYVCYMEAVPGSQPILQAQIGITPVEKQAGRFEISREKCHRLLDNLDHLLSWQTRDPDQRKWGGGIRAGNLLLAFSGFTEQEDEAVCLYAALMLGWLNRDEVLRFANISNNALIRRILAPANQPQP